MVLRTTLSRVPTALGALIAILMLPGCAQLQLQAFKKHANAGDPAWIASQPVTCRQRSETCGQLHLIRARACFELAISGVSPATHHACAAAALDRGLELRPSWPDANEQRWFHEMRCESVRNLLADPSTAAYRRTADRYTSAAQALYRLAPGSLPAVFYIADARLSRLRPVLVDLNAATRVPACNRLKRSLTDLLSTRERAADNPLSDWPRYADRYARLAFDLGIAIRAAGCR